MKTSMSEQDLIRRLGDLPREISPARDPWPEISARIEAGSGKSAVSSGGRSWLPMAAAAAVLVIVTGLFLGPLQTGSTGSPPLDNVRGPKAGGAQAALTLRGALAASESQYQAAFREFIPVEDSLGNLPPATIESIESGWAELNNTETVLTAALEQHPDDRFLNERMIELRARQLGFLKQLVRLDRSNRRMTI
jgi:hypothetical protein